MAGMSDGEVPARFGAYLRGRELGRGASGTVFACERQAPGAQRPPAQLAAKAIDLRRLRLSARAERELKKLQREIDILKRVPPHRNLVRFVDSMEHGHWCILILEFVGGGDLFSVLLRRGKRPCFREAETVFVLRQLVEGLEVLHAHGVIHRDLKLENILVVRERRDGPNLLCDVKITDFGLSKVVGEGLSAAQSTVGSPRYIAPEVLASGEHDFRADLWSLGVLIYVLLAGRFPVDGPGQAQAPQAALDGAVMQLEATAAAQAVVKGLLQVAREDRLTLHALRLHEWLAANCAALHLAKRPRIDLLQCSTVSLLGSEDSDLFAVLVPEEQEDADQATELQPLEADSAVLSVRDSDC